MFASFVRGSPLLLLLPLALAARPLSLVAQSCASGPPSQLGSVDVLPGECQPGPVANTICLKRRVRCQGLTPLDVLLRVTPPNAGVPERGTVVLGTGGGGTTFYSSSTGGVALINQLTANGFRVVDRAWKSGWFHNGVSVKRQSCRYATLLNHIHATIHVTGAFCVTGNSGGSGEIGYALSTWNMASILDVAVPTGGPPMSRLDYMCQNPPEWQQQCPGLIPPGAMSCTPPCTNAQDGQVCTTCSPNPSAADLLADSILHPAAVLSYPTTLVHFVFGSDDCEGPAVPIGLLFAYAIGPSAVIEFAPATPHQVYSTSAGRQAILDALLNGS